MKRQHIRSTLILGIFVAGGFVAGRMLAVGSYLSVALHHTRIAREELSRADRDKGGHRERALAIVRDAINEVERAVTFARRADNTPDPTYTIVRVHYGTNRTRIPDQRVRFDYDAQPAALTLGTATVSIPKDHRLGYWEKPLIRQSGTETETSSSSR